MAEDDELLVTISGPAFSMLLYENARIHDQIGFLLGETLIYVSKKVTDSEDRNVEDIKYHINIKNMVAYPIGEPFYNSIGQIHEDKLNNFLKDHVKNVVGWYHYRKEFRLVSSMRDKFMHTELSKFFSSSGSSSSCQNLQTPENFIFCLLNSSVSETGGTHKFKHLLLQKKGKVYKPVTLKINNLGADATKPDGTDYKPAPTASSCKSDAFDLVYDQIKNDLKRATSGVQSVTLIQKAAEHLLAKVIPEVTKTDREVSELELELFSLRNKYFYEKWVREHEKDDEREDEREHESTNSSECTTQIENQLRQMEVDSKSDVASEPKSPESLEIFDPPKSPVASSSTAPTAIKLAKQESGSGERTFDNTLRDRDLLIIQGKEPLGSPQGDVSRPQRFVTRSQKEDSKTLEQARNCKQRADNFIKSSVTKSQNRGLQRSPDYKPDDT